MKRLKRSLFIFFSVIAISGVSESAFAQTGGKGKRWRVHLHGGFLSEDFKGETGADFNRLSHEFYGLDATFLAFGFWENGLQYATISGVTVSPFTLTDGSIGQYKVGFTRYQFISGITWSKWRVHLVAGMESSTWKGQPNLGLKSASASHTGLQVTYDWLTYSWCSIPMRVAVLSHSKRKYEFSNFPADTVEINSGLEVAWSAGLAFGF